MVPTLANSAILSYSANSTSKIVKIYLRMILIRSVMSSFLKGTDLDCFESAVLDPIEPQWLSDFDLFIKELKANFRTYDPVGKAEAELEGLHMHESHQATKYFIKFQQLATFISGVMQNSINRLTMDSPNISKTIWFTTQSRPPLQDSKNLFKLSMHDIVNEKENSPTKP